MRLLSLLPVSSSVWTSMIVPPHSPHSRRLSPSVPHLLSPIFSAVSFFLGAENPSALSNGLSVACASARLIPTGPLPSSRLQLGITTSANTRRRLPLPARPSKPVLALASVIWCWRHRSRNSGDSKKQRLLQCFGIATYIPLQPATRRRGLRAGACCLSQRGAPRHRVAGIAS